MPAFGLLGIAMVLIPIPTNGWAHFIMDNNFKTEIF
jgi:hypothetical protein